MRIISSISVWFVLLFSLTSLSLAAQEQDLLKHILKESLKPDLLLELKPMDLDTAIHLNLRKKQIVLDVNKAPLPIATFNPFLDSLANNYDLSFFESPKLIVSPNLFMPYTNPKQHAPIDKMDGYIVLKPRPDAGATHFMVSVNPVAIVSAAVSYLMKAGVIPNEPFVPKMSKKQKALKNIKEIYQIDD
ncbi:hypothetical protein FACS18947_4900 [Bacteroidia bacterium]|nr:hypothetical protein FACS18947_4900 [Bacteroidia bacterium]